MPLQGTFSVIDGVAQGQEGGEKTPNVESFTPTLNQTVFTLKTAPLEPDHIEFEVNGVEFDNDVHFVVDGLTITWQGPFSLDSNDRVKVTY